MNCQVPDSPCTDKYTSEATFCVPSTPLLKQIGYGSGVSVYHLDRSPKVGNHQSPWALKKVNKNSKQLTSYARRLKMEAGILKSISHPNIVGFRGFMETEDGREVLALEECTYCLGDLIENYREMKLEPFEPPLINMVIVGVSKAFHYLHNKRNILHGDVKSYNVLIKGDFEIIKLCDFGVSLELDEKGEADVNDYVGTSCWSAPETLADGPITAKTDIFSLGLVIWEMLALQPPHLNDMENLTVQDKTIEDGENSILGEHKIGSRPSLQDIQLGPEYSTIVDIFNWCTEEDYQKRPTALDILHKLNEGETEEG